jgi:3-isopropylmalate dehydratase small subunit
MTMIEKIFATHSKNKKVQPGDIVDITIDVRVARDFGGASVVKYIRENNLPINNRLKTFFTFDCNPSGSHQKYAENQHICRMFAREYGIKVFDINAGIGTHIAIDKKLVNPGDTFVSTDSHANIVGAIGAFGQGMGDREIAYVFAYGKIWFKVPPTVKIVLEGRPSKTASAKDIALAMLKEFGANGLLGYAAEVYGDIVDELSLDARITISSMATEMGGIIIFFPNNSIFPDKNAKYAKIIKINIDNLEPLISRPGHPEDVVKVKSLVGTKIDSVFIGSCTNGRFDDLKSAAEILKHRKVAEGVVLKIVPSTDEIWKKCLEEGLIDIFKTAGALVGNAGCAGCAEGQIGQNGTNEVTISTGNRNFTGKQGNGKVFLTSPVVAAASAVAGVISLPDKIPAVFVSISPKLKKRIIKKKMLHIEKKPTLLRGKVWVIPKDNIDTDMIYHNRYLTITDINEVGKYAFSNLEGWKDFPQKASKGDIIITGKNFGAGSSRQQAVDCFKSLGISLIIAESFGAIYERNAINAGLPILCADLISKGIKTGDEIEVNLETGVIKNITTGKKYTSTPFSKVQMEIYQRGGLL